MAVPDSGTNYIDSLLHNRKWSDSGSTSTGQSATVTYSLDLSDWGYDSSGASVDTDNDWVNGSASLVNSTQEAAIVAALDSWSSVANITFQDVGTSQGDNTDMVFRQARTNTTGLGGWAATWTYSSDRIAKVDILLNDGYGSALGSISHPVGGTWAYQAIIHEIGHGIGLEHPFEDDDGDSLDLEQDQFAYSVMSYTDGSQDIIAVSPMIYDIAAVQYLYGANTSHASGNNTYTLDGTRSTDGNDYSQNLTAQYGYVGETIWDGGGNDTINVTYSGGAIIDLREGYQYRSVVGTTKVWNAFGANIENATGGSGDDTINGNDLGNYLAGGAGVDTIYGHGGDDTIAYNTEINVTSGDSYIAGGGTDTLRLLTNDSTWASIQSEIIDFYANSLESNNSNTFSFSFGLDVFGFESATVYVDGVEIDLDNIGGYITGTSGNDTLTSQNERNIINGLGGDDTIINGPQRDTIDGGAGNDTLNHNVAVTQGVISSLAENFTINDGFGNNEIIANIENLYGSSMNDYLYGDSNSNILRGYGGNDVIKGFGDDDTIYGDTGIDTLFGNDGTDLLYGDDDNDLLLGGNGNDTLYGGSGADRLRGEGDDDTLAGGGGIDYLYGGAGSDTADYSQAASGVIATLTGGYALDDGDGSYDRYMDSIENITGSSNNDYIYGDSGGNILSGGAGIDVIKSFDGDDTLIGGAGIDRLFGGDGDDTYFVGRTSEIDYIHNSDSTSTNDQLLFDSDIAHDQLWFERWGDNLRVEIIGTSVDVNIQGWYTGAAAQVDYIRSGDGFELAASDVQTLVDAMASEVEPGMGETDLSGQTATNLDPIITSVWAAV